MEASRCMTCKHASSVTPRVKSSRFLVLSGLKAEKSMPHLPEEE